MGKLGYSREKIKHVQECIYSHRGSKKIPRKSIEAKIVASADAMSHFDNLAGLFRIAFAVYDFSTSEARKWVLEKLGRSWQKLIPEARKMFEDRYVAIKMALA